MDTKFPLDIARVNFNILKHLRGTQKMRIIYTNQLELDRRWLQSSRRTLSGDSRKDLLYIIEKTFDTMRYSDPMFTEIEQQTLFNLQKVFKKTYPDYYDLHGPDGLIHTLLTRSRSIEAQRKAHEIIKEYSTIRKPLEYPDLFEPNPKNIVSDMHTINVDDEDKDQKCCL